MNRFLPLGLCLLFATTGCAQTPDAKKEEPKAEASPETKADLTAFLKKQYPDIDPAGEHNYTQIKNYTDARKRFVYTRAMARLLSFYIEVCGHGALLAKQFDAWANTELVNQPTFNALHSIVCTKYPDGRPNVQAAQDLINRALQQDPKFEYAHYLNARIQYLALLGGGGNRAELDASIKAAFIHDDFVEVAALKARLLLTSKPADNAGAKAILDKCFEFTPDDPAVFQEVLGLYAESAGVTALKNKIELAISAKKFPRRYEGEARAFMGYVFTRERDFDAAIKNFDSALALVKPEDDAFAVIRWQLKCAGTWASMAMDLRETKPKLEGQDRKLYDGYVKAARDHVALAAELERTLMPVDARGPAAGAYIEFVGAQIGDYPAVIGFLQNYLEKTDLRANVRSGLERMLNDLLARTAGDESAAIKNIKVAHEKNDVNNLVVELSSQAENVRAGKFHFKQPSSFAFFLELMKHQNATVAQLVAFLLVDTAMLSAKPEDIEAAANAIALRLEQEKEMTTEALVKFQGALIASLMIFDKRNVDLRAVKALRVIVAGTQELLKTESELIGEAREVIQLLNNDDWLKKVWGESGGRTMRSSQQRRFDKLLPWLDENIAQLEKITAVKEEK
jgi:tetratricopeptide (TPR) repeat protein